MDTYNRKSVVSVNRFSVIFSFIVIAMKGQRKPIGPRLKMARTAKGYSVDEVARRIGLAAQTIRNHENLKAVALENLREYSAIYGVDIDWLEHGDGPLRPKASELEILLMGTVGAGTSVQSLDDNSWNNAVDTISLPSVDRTFALLVKGDSAMPRYHDGDVLLVDKKPLLEHEALNTYCVIDLKDGRRVVKMLEEANGGYVLKSQNPETPLEKNPQILGCYRICGVLLK